MFMGGTMAGYYNQVNVAQMGGCHSHWLDSYSCDHSQLMVKVPEWSRSSKIVAVQVPVRNGPRLQCCNLLWTFSTESLKLNWAQHHQFNLDPTLPQELDVAQACANLFALQKIWAVKSQRLKISVVNGQTAEEFLPTVTAVTIKSMGSDNSLTEEFLHDTITNVTRKEHKCYDSATMLHVSDQQVMVECCLCHLLGHLACNLFLFWFEYEYWSCDRTKDKCFAIWLMLPTFQRLPWPRFYQKKLYFVYVSSMT